MLNIKWDFIWNKVKPVRLSKSRTCLRKKEKKQMNIIKKLRSWYYELWDYIDESEYVLINKKGKVVAIIDRLNPITYTILSHIFTESHDIYATKEVNAGGF